MFEFNIIWYGKKKNGKLIECEFIIRNNFDGWIVIKLLDFGFNGIFVCALLLHTQTVVDVRVGQIKEDNVLAVWKSYSFARYIQDNLT